jgi:hypothetical protein
MKVLQKSTIHLISLAEFLDMAIGHGDAEATVEDVWLHVVADQDHQGIDHLSPFGGGSVAHHQADARINLWIGEVPIPRQDPTDVCFSQLKYPGTNAWRETLPILSNQTWSAGVYFEMRRQLRGRRFLICRNSTWCWATEDEIYLKSKGS